MNKKIIIGLTGDSTEARTKVAKAFENTGFLTASIHSKVEEFLKNLGLKEISSETVDQARRRAYNVSNKYWINIVLSSLPKDKDLILICDMYEEDRLPIINAVKVSKDGGDNSIDPDSDNLSQCVHNQLQHLVV